MGYKLPTICCILREEGLIANRVRIQKFLQKHWKTNNIERRPGHEGVAATGCEGAAATGPEGAAATGPEGVAATGHKGAAATGHERATTIEHESFFIVSFSDESFCGRFTGAEEAF